MKAIRFTDTERQPKGGYKRAAETNVEATFKRVRAEQAKNQAEAAPEPVTPKRAAQ